MFTCGYIPKNDPCYELFRNMAFNNAVKKILIADYEDYIEHLKEQKRGLKKMRTFDKKDVLSAINIEGARCYVNSIGYFGNNLKEIQKAINSGKPTTLCKIEEEAELGLIFQHSYNLVGHNANSLFLPDDKVKEVEEKEVYRPFNNFSEFRTVTNTEVGEMLTLKLKLGDIIRYVLVEGVVRFPDLHDEIYLSTINQNNSISYTYLFDSFLFLDRTLDEWRVLGMEEDSSEV